jgi:predicted MPP superfamily phosphohydrolase
MNRRQFLGLSAAGGAAFLAGDMLVEAERLEVTHHRAAIGPARDTSISMAQITDLHLQRFGRHEENIVRAANEPRPDCMLITGDSVDDRTKLGVLEEFMSHLNPEVPKYAILGNWEYWSGVDFKALSVLYSRHNCELLVDRSVIFDARGKRIRMAGFDDYIGSHGRSRGAVADISPVDGELLLAHCPYHRDVVPHRQSVMLSGHTHGGQINLGGLFQFTPPGSGHYLKGWYLSNTLYVSRGLGTSKVPLRLNSVPELARFEFLA